MEKKELSEELLEGWLMLSMSVWNKRLVSAMTYNESMVCNLLVKQRQRGGELLTPTDLCNSLRIRKSQMNVILNRMEKEDMVIRTRSREDKRNVYISLTEKGAEIYQAAHEEILELPQKLIEYMGEEKIHLLSVGMKEAALSFQRIIAEK